MTVAGPTLRPVRRDAALTVAVLAGGAVVATALAIVHDDAAMADALLAAVVAAVLGGLFVLLPQQLGLERVRPAPPTARPEALGASVSHAGWRALPVALLLLYAAVARPAGEDLLAGALAGLALAATAGLAAAVRWERGNARILLLDAASRRRGLVPDLYAGEPRRAAAGAAARS